MSSTSDDQASVRIGRQPSTSRSQLSHIALQLFIENGFEQTTVDDIAAAAGIGRRTLFRYFASKNDLPWGDFDAGLASMRELLANLPEDMPLVEALSVAVIEFNRFPVEEVPFHRARMDLLLNVPALVAHSTLRYVEWRRVVSDYAAYRLGIPEDSIRPQAIAWIFLGTSLSAYEQWLKHDDADLTELLQSAFAMLRDGFSAESLGDGG
ncbi:mycofactocin system transcriptional regulator [Lacisediminihabitans changchengi]|uniref:Mycofactocin system transcriptional regulator n=1 Tax=Lacisediminihabitans changchengi TaxID=2787634 RepID=A0A934W5I7_9MICO|nr:mycofactocin system transcriptional regulator [Lacisediminihabitans changchengi]MBK4348555.1 mycofactocin system transcriptional regulator [Lacisediminihabitans changchengi]